ncbi:MAG TPA: hypothetical protein VN408_01440 [Actinoplanes sp.]|nr:hypothetical protein [Actinoplanes sp.]
MAIEATLEKPSLNRESSVADLLFVVLTVALFTALTVLVKAAER